MEQSKIIDMLETYHLPLRISFNTRLGDVLNSLRSLSFSGEPCPDCGQDGWEADVEEIQSPPTTHFVATIDDLTDMLDYDSEDIYGMYDDAGDE